jgi:hypothetical protein
MKGAVLCAPRDVRFEERSTPKIVEPTDAIVRTSATCVCGSDLWPYRGLNPINGPTSPLPCWPSALGGMPRTRAGCGNAQTALVRRLAGQRAAGCAEFARRLLPFQSSCW